MNHKTVRLIEETLEKAVDNGIKKLSKQNEFFRTRNKLTEDAVDNFGETKIGPIVLELFKANHELYEHRKANKILDQRFDPRSAKYHTINY